MLHPGLNSLRHEQRLLFGGLQVSEHFPHPAAVPVETQGEADPSFGFRAIDWHHCGARFDLEKGACFFAPSLGGAFPRFVAILSPASFMPLLGMSTEAVLSAVFL
jgi:hypothetical protein